MSDEERRAALEYLIRTNERLREAFKPLVKALSEFVRKVGPLLARFRRDVARWEWMQARLRLTTRRPR
jgi:hypothetical protein